MKAKLIVAIFFIVSLAPICFGQQAKLEGFVTDDKGNRMAKVKIIAPGGQENDTDSDGHFIITFPSRILPGLPMRIDIGKPGWVIYTPMFGDCETQNATQNFKPLPVIIVPKGSPLALTPKRLSQVIDRWADERVRRGNQIKDLQSQLDEYAFLREYAEKYGFTLEQFRAAADQWAKIQGLDDKGERALKEYWRKNYDSTYDLAIEAARGWDEESERRRKGALDADRQLIRHFRLAGNARYEQYKFREALAAYNEIEARFSARKLSKEDLAKEWAETKNIIGIMNLELGRRVGGQEALLFLSAAAAATRATLDVYTRERLPQDWAAIQDNLGNILLQQGERLEGAKGTLLLEQAVAANRAALEVRTREGMPREYSITQNNLGNILMRLGERVEGARGVQFLEQSEEAYRAAFQIMILGAPPRLLSATLSNMGNVLQVRAERVGGAEGIRLLKRAIDLYQFALRYRDKDQQPQEWAETQNNLGIALMKLGGSVEGIEGAKLLGQAAAAYREALLVYKRELLPQLWAGTQNNLGNVLQRQGEFVDGVEGMRLFGQAVEAYRAALLVYTREQLPQDWAMTQTNLGSALQSQGDELKGAEGFQLLEQAVAAYRAALQVRTRDALPQQWAETQSSLGSGLRSLGERLEGAEGLRLLEQSIAAYRAVLQIHTREHIPAQWARTHEMLGNALSSYGQRLSGEQSRRLLSDAVNAYRATLEIYTREHFPQRWIITRNKIAGIYWLLQNWEEAALAYENVLSLVPDYEQGYQRLSTIYHERVFEYAKAHALHDQWLRRFPKDASAQADFAETDFTTGRFAEFSARLKPLLAHPELPAATKIALQMIEVANLLILDQATQVPAALTSLRETIAAQPAAFRITWSFAGTLHFINQPGQPQEKLAAYRARLQQFFAAAQGADRDAILQALRAAQAQFPPADKNQRK